MENIPLTIVMCNMSFKNKIVSTLEEIGFTADRHGNLVKKYTRHSTKEKFEIVVYAGADEYKKNYMSVVCYNYITYISFLAGENEFFKESFNEKSILKTIELSTIFSCIISLKGDSSQRRIRYGEQNFGDIFIYIAEDDGTYIKYNNIVYTIDDV